MEKRSSAQVPPDTASAHGSYLGRYLSDAYDALAEEDPDLTAALCQAHAAREAEVDLRAEAPTWEPTLAACRVAAPAGRSAGQAVRNLALSRARGLLGVPHVALYPGSPERALGELVAGPIRPLDLTDDACDLHAAAEADAVSGEPLLIVTIRHGTEPVDFAGLRVAADRAGRTLWVDTTAVTPLILALHQPGPLGPARVWLTRLAGTETTLVGSSSPVADAAEPPSLPATAAAARLLHLAATGVWRRSVRAAVDNARECHAELRAAGTAVVGDHVETTTVLIDVPDSTAAQQKLGELGVRVDAASPHRLSVSLDGVTARGFGRAEARDLAEMLNLVLSSLDGAGTPPPSTKSSVRRLASQFPLPRRSGAAWLSGAAR